MWDDNNRHATASVLAGSLWAVRTVTIPRHHLPVTSEVQSCYPKSRNDRQERTISPHAHMGSRVSSTRARSRFQHVATNSVADLSSSPQSMRTRGSNSITMSLSLQARQVDVDHLYPWLGGFHCLVSPASRFARRTVHYLPPSFPLISSLGRALSDALSMLETWLAAPNLEDHFRTSQAPVMKSCFSVVERNVLKQYTLPSITSYPSLLFGAVPQMSLASYRGGPIAQNTYCGVMA